MDDSMWVELLVDKGLVAAFLFVGLITWLSYWLSKHVTRGYVHGSAIAIAIAAAATGGLCIGLPDDAGFIIGHCAIVIVAVMFGGPLASISTVLKDKSTKSLPFAFTVATLVNCVAWSSYGIFVIDDYIVWLPNMLGLAAAIAQLGLFAKFGIHKDENNALVDDPENPKKM